MYFIAEIISDSSNIKLHSVLIEDLDDNIESILIKDSESSEEFVIKRIKKKVEMFKNDEHLHKTDKYYDMLNLFEQIYGELIGFCSYYLRSLHKREQIVLKHIEYMQIKEHTRRLCFTADNKCNYFFNTSESCEDNVFSKIASDGYNLMKHEGGGLVCYFKADTFYFHIDLPKRNYKVIEIKIKDVQSLKAYLTKLKVMS